MGIEATSATRNSTGSSTTVTTSSTTNRTRNTGASRRRTSVGGSTSAPPGGQVPHGGVVRAGDPAGRSTVAPVVAGVELPARRPRLTAAGQHVHGHSGRKGRHVRGEAGPARDLEGHHPYLERIARGPQRLLDAPHVQDVDDLGAEGDRAVDRDAVHQA